MEFTSGAKPLAVGDEASRIIAPISAHGGMSAASYEDLNDYPRLSIHLSQTNDLRYEFYCPQQVAVNAGLKR